jgi:CubicO group peptidase (beta-lactamase class C family)
MVMRSPFQRARSYSLSLICAVPLALNPVAAAEDAPLNSRVDAYIQPYVASNNFSGVVLIARNGKILVNRAYGQADRERDIENQQNTRFHIASVSKSFTAAAILLLEQRGKLSVNDPLSRFIPDYPNGNRITLHQLLCHRSGIVNANNLPEYPEKSKSRISLNDVIAMFKNSPLVFEPGSRFQYSNSNYNLLAYIIEKVSGQTYGDFLRKNIFDPLDMRDTADDNGTERLTANQASGYIPEGMTGVSPAPDLNWSIKGGNGSLYSTAGDLYKWDRALYTDKILNRCEREKMFTDYGGFGYGWFVRSQAGREATIINGRSPGFTASLQRFVNDGLCIIVLANTYSGITQSLADDLSAIAFGEAKPALQPSPRLARAALNEYAGQYQFGQDFTFNPGATATIVVRGDDLALNIGGDDSYLIAQPGGMFLDRLYGGKVEFLRDAKGALTQLSWSFGTPFFAKRLPAASTPGHLRCKLWPCRASHLLGPRRSFR